MSDSESNSGAAVGTIPLVRPVGNSASRKHMLSACVVAVLHNAVSMQLHLLKYMQSCPAAIAVSSHSHAAQAFKVNDYTQLAASPVPNRSVVCRRSRSPVPRASLMTSPASAFNSEPGSALKPWVVS
jgi:hypothetical protein